MIEVAVRKLREDAVLPRQAYEGDAGVDLAACESLTLRPGERGSVSTGIAVEIVLNKVDAVDALHRRRLENRFPASLQVSALTGEGLVELKRRIAARFAHRFETVRLLVPYEEGSALADLYALGAPIAERRDTPEGVRVRARLPRREIARFARFLVAGELDAEVSAR